MTTETTALMIERDIALQVAVGDPEPISVDDAAVLVAEIRRLRTEVGYMDAENQRIREINDRLRARLNEAAEAEQ